VSAYIEKKVEEVIEQLERRGYWALCQRDSSQWGSVYILLCLPPISMYAAPRKTSYVIRVSDHPPRPDKLVHITASVHPGSDDVSKAWRQTKAIIEKDMAARRQESMSKVQNEQAYYRYKTERKKKICTRS
jgi:hypothetical protein